MLSQQDVEDFLEVEAALVEPDEGNVERKKVPGAAEIGTDFVDGQHKVREPA